PGLYKAYDSAGKRIKNVFVDDSGNRVSDRQYYKALRGGISNERYAALSQSEKRIVRTYAPRTLLPPRQTRTFTDIVRSAVSPRTGRRIIEPTDQPTPLEELAAIQRTAKTRYEHYRRVQEWFDKYGEEYPDIDYDDIYVETS